MFCPKPLIKGTKATLMQQDGATPQTATSVIKWFEDCEVDSIKDWSGNRPDISPTESHWEKIKRDLQGKGESTVPKLEKYIRKSWKRIPGETFQNLALSVPRRLKIVIEHKGCHTKY